MPLTAVRVKKDGAVVKPTEKKKAVAPSTKKSTEPKEEKPKKSKGWESPPVPTSKATKEKKSPLVPTLNDEGIPHEKTIAFDGMILENRMDRPIRFYHEVTDEKPFVIIDITEPSLKLEEITDEYDRRGSVEGVDRKIPVACVSYKPPKEHELRIPTPEDFKRGFIVPNLFPKFYERSDLFLVDAGLGAVKDPNTKVMIGTTRLIHAKDY